MSRLSNKKCYLLDMDGTIYLGDQLIDGADDFLKKIKALEKRYIFVTNNSSKSKNSYVKKLQKMGIKANDDEVFTSTEATIIYLNKIKKGAKVFLLGNKDLEQEFEDAGFKLVRARDEKIDFVVVGFDTTLTYEKLWIACDYIVAGTKYVATHADLVCPLENGKFMPDAGAIIAFIKAATEREPIVIGKPNKYMVDAILNKYSLKKEDLAIVGDRLYTDIRTGIENGIDSILVLSGETDKKMLETTEFIPDYVFDSVKDMISLL